ncbi:hypothetical protein KSP35_12220 [Aquihabitans sp. G128]|uniref:helix-turn-helix domain-containing protein n=1 Tax=Aquihabitans sp. G128 TaxID=2849779 RepID=UPI001C21E168|nr:hypothetical protein [Aquihabitans sp. G128]QXC59176.1 hypothetical protein KSP35_12220 [Aquihabitans sp. G128]
MSLSTSPFSLSDHLELDRHRYTDDDVLVIHLPEQNELRFSLDGSDRARLLVIAADAAPPVCPDPLEDWVRADAGDLELSARVASLRTRLQRRVERPCIDEWDLLTFRDDWIALSPTEAAAARVLLANFGELTLYEQLPDTDESGDRSTRAARIKRLRARLLPIGLSITTVRGRGLVLQAG